jgi:hypothetical protein
MNNESAFPVVETGHEAESVSLGLSKRECFAGLAMQGLIACGDVKFKSTAENFAQYAVAIADALLAELSKNQP